MIIESKQVSIMIRGNDMGSDKARETESEYALAGERVTYQVFLREAGEELLYAPVMAEISVESSLSEYVKLFCVKNAVMDTPFTLGTPSDTDVCIQPGLVPDILVPLDEQYSIVSVDRQGSAILVRVDIPQNTLPGNYDIRLRISCREPGCDTTANIFRTMTITILPAKMPVQKLIYTRWIYLDCIANIHGVSIFSEAHWELIDRYIAVARDLGINMILVPVHTPPLDTEIGHIRPCVQLIDIEKEGERYRFSFERLHRFISLCKKNGIRYYEIAHMFSQWGAKHAPNIKARENGRERYLFGWQTDADDPEYISFLNQYIDAISAVMEEEGVSENTYFHISDEPQEKDIDAYRRAYEIIRPRIGACKTFDAISDYAFYERGLIECPVTGIQNIHTFLEHKIHNQWGYYCCQPQSVFPNSFLAQPAYQIRVIGFLFYKYDVKGFLHWGFNFYNACRSLYRIDPYITTSGDGAFPSGDPFIVYPAKDGVYSSVRGEILYAAIQDMNLCLALEERIGRREVEEMIDRAAGGELRFDSYPRSNEFIVDLRKEIIARIKDSDGK